MEYKEEKKKSKKIEDPHVEEGGEGEEAAWLTSYADMMTVLCCFFIMLVSMANFEDPVVIKFMNKMGEHFSGSNSSGKKPAQEDKDTKDKMETLVDEIASHPMLKAMSKTNLKNDVLAITFQSTIVFADGGHTISDDVAIAIDALIDIIKTKDPNFNIVVEGHTDNRPPPPNSPFTSNWALASARAASVIERFEYFGFERNRLKVVSLGDTQPLVPNEDKNGKPIEENMKMNRRVVIKVIQPKDKKTSIKMGLDVYFDQ